MCKKVLDVYVKIIVRKLLGKEWVFYWEEVFIENVEKLKSLQKDLHEEFINLVKNSRKNKLKSEN